MNKRIICLVALFALFSSSFADTLLMRGSKPITNLKDKIFLQGDEFIGLFEKELMNDESKIDRVYVFDVNIKDKEMLKNPNLIMKELSSHHHLRNYFGDASKAYTSTYIQSAYNTDFNQKLLNAATSQKFEVQNLKLKDFEFTKANKVVEMINVDWNQLGKLDTLFQKYRHQFESGSKNNFVVMMKFTDKTDEVAPEPVNISLAQINSRVLQDSGSSGATTAKVIPITSPGLAAFVITIGLGIFVYIGCIILNEIKVPSKFYNKPFVVGEVQL